MKLSNWSKTLGAGLLVLALATNPALAGQGNQGNPGILPPQSTPNDMSYGSWSDAWWAWVLSIPATNNPMFDVTGECVAIGQAGPVWFLAGNQGGVTERTVTIPAGKALFFPLVNYVWINTPPPVGTDPEWSPEQEAAARAMIAAAIDTATDLACEIDGRAVKNLESYRCQTPVGGAQMVTLPDGDIFGVGAGTYGPMVTDGYYLMLAPLKAGPHTLHFTASLAGGFHLDVTYHLTVQ